jgi:tripartite-type tricarboxylate transporter receptor subunit TctC
MRGADSMKRAIQLVLTIAASAFLIAGLPEAYSQTYPAKPIRMIMAVGGGAEVVIRLVGQRLTETMGQPVVIEVQSGAGGAIGAEMVARSAADGYTLLVAAPSSQIVRLFVTKNTPYDPIRDFTAVARLVDTVVCIMASASAPVNSLNELIDYAKRNPGKLSYGSSGYGTGQQISFEMFKKLTSVDIVHVPYKSGAQALTALVSDQVPLSTGILATAMPYLKTAKLKVLALIREKRYAGAPEIPIVGELVPEFEAMASWMGTFGPAGMQAPLVRRLNGEINKAMNVPEIRSKSEEIGFVVGTSAPEEFAAEVKHDYVAIGNMIKAVGIQPE